MRTHDRYSNTTARDYDDFAPPLMHEEPSTGSQTLACFLSGLIVGVVVGVIIGRLAATSWAGHQVLFGAILGGVLGMIFGRKIAGFETVLGGAAFGAFCPVALCVLDGLRRGRLQGADLAKDIQDPRFTMILGIVLGSGALIGGLLVGVRKLIVRGF